MTRSIKILALLMSLILTFCALAACNDNGDVSADDDTENTAETEAPTEEIKTFPLIEDKKSLYRIIRPEVCSSAISTAAGMIHTHLMENGIKSELKGDWNKQEIGSDIREILVGNTQYTPELDFPFELEDLGSTGFVIKNVGNKILILAGND